MKFISYILLGIAGAVAIIGGFLFFKQKNDKRQNVLDSLEKARQAKAEKRKSEVSQDIAEMESLQDQIEKELINNSNHGVQSEKIES